MQAIVILLMQSGTTLHELISPYDTIMTPFGNGAILSFILIG